MTRVTTRRGGAGIQACPAAPATISGIITDNDVVGPAAQGIGARKFAELIDGDARRSTYENMHSVTYGGGEIRARLGHRDVASFTLRCEGGPATIVGRWRS